MHIEWNDLQTVEALVRLGTVAAAGRELGLRHTSVGRRIDALEARLQALLFLRGRRLVPTALAHEVAGRVTRMAHEAADVEALVAGARRAREARLVVTTNDVLAPLLFAALATLEQGPRVEVRVSDVEEPLAPGLTDLALRPSGQPAGELRGWRLGRLTVGVFAPRGSKTTRWVLPNAALRERQSMRWWKSVPTDATAVVECSSLQAMREACAAGLGRAVLPVVLGQTDARLSLERLLDVSVPLWLLAAVTPPSAPALARALSLSLRSGERVGERGRSQARRA